MPNHAMHHDDAPTAPIQLPEPTAPRRPKRRAALIAACAIGLSVASGTAGAAAVALTQATNTPAAVAAQAAPTVVPAVVPERVVAPKTTTATPSTRHASTTSDDDTEATTTRRTSTTSPKTSSSKGSKSGPSAAECREIRDHYLYDSALPNAAIGPQLRGQGCGAAADSLLVGSAN